MRKAAQNALHCAHEILASLREDNADIQVLCLRMERLYQLIEENVASNSPAMKRYLYDASRSLQHCSIFLRRMHAKAYESPKQDLVTCDLMGWIDALSQQADAVPVTALSFLYPKSP